MHIRIYFVKVTKSLMVRKCNEKDIDVFVQGREDTRQ